MRIVSGAALGVMLLTQGCAGLLLTAATTASTNQALNDRARYGSLSCAELRTEFAKNHRRAYGVTTLIDPGAAHAQANVYALGELLVDKKCRLPPEIEVV